MMRDSPIPLKARMEAITLAIMENDDRRALELRGDLYVELLEYFIEANHQGDDIINDDIIKFLKTENLFR
jgi:hypothetical protein